MSDSYKPDKSYIYNSLDDIYRDGMYIKGDYYICSVCSKRYKTKKGADRHISRKNCYRSSDLFKGTYTEEVMVYLHDMVLLYSGFASKNTVSIEYKISTFRRSKKYDLLSEFMLLCFKNNITDYKGLLRYVFDFKTKDPCFAWQVLERNLEQPQSLVKSFYRYKRRFKKDYSFFLNNIKVLKRDPDFAIRSFERGDINFQQICSLLSNDKFQELLSDVDVTRIELIQSISNDNGDIANGS